MLNFDHMRSFAFTKCHTHCWSNYISNFFSFSGPPLTHVRKNRERRKDIHQNVAGLIPKFKFHFQWALPRRCSRRTGYRQPGAPPLGAPPAGPTLPPRAPTPGETYELTAVGFTAILAPGVSLIFRTLKIYEDEVISNNILQQELLLKNSTEFVRIRVTKRKRKEYGICRSR